ncbi:MAG: glycosyltransferase, partial [Candidatus Binatia bacterium]
MPKVLLEVGGRPLLTRNLELLRDQLGIRDVYVVVGYLAEHIRAAYGDGGGLGMRIRYLDNADVDGGLGTLLKVVEPHVDEPFVCLLGDELYLETNHAALAQTLPGYAAVCGIYPTEDMDLIRKNYAVELDGERIRGLVEKPETAPTPYLGCGTYLFAPEIYRDARETPRSPRTGRLELTDVIDHAARRGADVRAFVLSGHYRNVNTVADLNEANFLSRTVHWGRNKVSVVIPAYNEAAAIGFVIRDFKDQVDEIVVMDNQSADGTGKIASDLGATVYSRPLKGYGDALKQGLDAATGQILVLVEADGTFRARDLGKLLEFLKDADMVIGTRTTRQMIEQGTNMRGIVRAAHIALAMLLQLLWWRRASRFTDICCVYRALWRSTYVAIRDHLTAPGIEVFPEMVIEVLRARRRIIEIPVNYYNRDL